MWYWLFRMINIVVLRLFFRLKVEGIENLPKKNNFIVVANHTSFLDPLIIAAAIPKKIHCITSRLLFKMPLLKWILPKLEALPTSGSSIKAIEFLTENRIVGLFPEGGCSRDGRLRKFKTGAALLALKTGRPIVPCAILGAYEALPAKAKILKFTPLKVKISKPIFLLKEFGTVINDIYLQEGIFRIKNTIKEMVNAG